MTPPGNGRARGYRRSGLASRRDLRDDSRGMLPTGVSVNITTNDHRRQGGPIQAVAPGPKQAVVLSTRSFQRRDRRAAGALRSDGQDTRGPR